MKNRKYQVNKKNGGEVPPIPDYRVTAVPVGCGKCIECRKQKAREWNVRLLEDIKKHTNGKFITLTFSNEQIAELYKIVPTHLKGYDIDNAIATIAVQRFLGRWRKEYGTSIRHWLVTELGHTGTEHLHLHGIIWTNEPLEKVEQHWGYGLVWKGKRDSQSNRLINYVNGQTVNYIVKYVNKTDEDHPNYRSIILTSPGIGANYTKGHDWKKNLYNEQGTNELYRTTTGHKMAMPIYWRNKIYTEDQREKLWLKKLDKQERWVCGERVSIKDGDKNYYTLLAYHRIRNTEMGYGDDKLTWEQHVYEQQRRTAKIQERIQNRSANARHKK